ncbi:MAG: amino acid permease [Deltaproteobacteria bacterium]|nr:amino acid permease [Deltaproteobacteria bacterium]
MNDVAPAGARQLSEPKSPRHQLGLFSAVILVVANMVGTGIFTTSGFIIQELQNPWAMLFCWALGGLFALTGALCYGELGARFPRAGGEYVFLRESFGEPLAFLSGWVSLLVGFSAPIAAAAMAFAVYFLGSAGLGLNSGFTWTVQGLTVLTLSPVTLLASGVILAFSFIHRHSLFLGSHIQNLLTLFKVVLILALVFLGLAWGAGSASHFGALPPLRVFFSGQFATSLIFITFAYSGWNAAAYMGSEISRPTRNIPLALALGTLVVTILYLLLNMTFVYGLSAQEMSGVLEVGEKAALALFGPEVSRGFAGAIALSLLSLISAMMMTGPRIYQAMAGDGLFFTAFGRLRGGSGPPGNAILLQAGLALVMVFTASFENLLIFIGFTLSLFSLITVVGLMVLRHRQPAPGLPYRTAGYPVTPLFFIMCNLWIVLFSIINKPLVSLTGLAAAFLGVLLYIFFKRRAAVYCTPCEGK